MTREEAIEYWDWLRKTFSNRLEKEENCFGRMHLQTTIDALDVTLDCLREQEEREKPKPLTLDELWQMDGEPVWLETGEVSFGEQIIGSWEIFIGRESAIYYFTRRKRGFFAEHYGKRWLAYRRRYNNGRCKRLPTLSRLPQT